MHFMESEQAAMGMAGQLEPICAMCCLPPLAELRKKRSCTRSLKDGPAAQFSIQQIHSACDLTLSYPYTTIFFHFSPVRLLTNPQPR